jgi:anti-sigma regulatory factor (Ser/Thr protein kinase)
MIAEPETHATGTSGTWFVDSTDIASVMAAKASLMTFLQTRGVVGAAYDDCALAVSELLGNAIRHAHPGPIEVKLDWSGARPRLAVTNAGESFPVVIERAPLERESGRGLFILAKVLETPRVDSHDGRCTVSLSLPVDKA